MNTFHRNTNVHGFAYWLLPLIAGVLLGVLLHDFIHFDPVLSATIPRNATADFQLMAQAWNTIEQHYVDRLSVQPRNMTYGAISGMVDSLGDAGHSGFLTPAMVKDERMIEVGQFIGIGIEVQMKNDRVVIVAPMDGSPAQKAGLHPGDIIIKVGGINAGGRSLTQVIGMIRGPVGTRVMLTVEDPATGLDRTVNVTRSNIPLDSVSWHMLPEQQIAHVRVALFSKGTSEALEKALAEIEHQGATGVILDLRNNPGGLLDTAVHVASQFLMSGTVLQEKNAKGEIRPVAVASRVSKCTLPMVVLINAGTASASEIVAGALQDARRSAIVGETSFGTGTVLDTVPLSDGSELMLAVLEWLTPRGRTIWHKGITPDVSVSISHSIAPLFPQMERGISLEQLRASKDLQLRRALDVLVHVAS